MHDKHSYEPQQQQQQQPTTTTATNNNNNFEQPLATTTMDDKDSCEQLQRPTTWATTTISTPTATTLPQTTSTMSWRVSILLAKVEDIAGKADMLKGMSLSTTSEVEHS